MGVRAGISSHVKRVAKMVVAWGILGWSAAGMASPPDHAAWRRQVVQSPALQPIQQRMSDRFQRQLKEALQQGWVGVSATGWLAVRPDSGAPEWTVLSVQDENRDRKELYRLLARGQGRPEWADPIRLTFAEEWLLAAERSGWWVQDRNRSWSAPTAHPPE